MFMTGLSYGFDRTAGRTATARTPTTGSRTEMLPSSCRRDLEAACSAFASDARDVVVVFGCDDVLDELAVGALDDSQLVAAVR